MRVMLDVTIEAKDEWAEGEGRLPHVGEIAPNLQDVLVDATRRDYENFPWKVRAVREVREVAYP